VGKTLSFALLLHAGFFSQTRVEPEGVCFFNVPILLNSPTAPCPPFPTHHTFLCGDSRVRFAVFFFLFEEFVPCPFFFVQRVAFFLLSVMFFSTKPLFSVVYGIRRMLGLLLDCFCMCGRDLPPPKFTSTSFTHPLFHIVALVSNPFPRALESTPPLFALFSPSPAEGTDCLFFCNRLTFPVFSLSKKIAHNP